MKILLAVFATSIFVGSLLMWASGSSEVALPAAHGQYIDLHVHTAGLDYHGSGAFVSEELLKGWKSSIYLSAFGVTEDTLETQGDDAILAGIAQSIRDSLYISQAVILALDGVVDPSGNLDRRSTQVYVPNDFLITKLSQYPELLFGASINPYRKDALERLEHVVENGAVLLKWIPNIMLIDPADPELEPFYRRMAEYNLPLLTHTGQERSFKSSNDKLGDPVRLELPLLAGVTVIAAHIGTTGHNEKQPNFERMIPMLLKYPNLYADISSLTQINKLRYLRKALAIDGMAERLVYGSDWPLQFFPLISPLYHLDQITLSEAMTVHKIENPWDKDTALKKFMGVPETVFQRSADLLRLPNTSKSNNRVSSEAGVELGGPN